MQETSERNEQPELTQEAQVAEEVTIKNKADNDSEAEEIVIEHKVVREEILEESQKKNLALETTKVERRTRQPEETITKQRPESKEEKKETLSAEKIIAQELEKANMKPATPKKQPETEQQQPDTKVIAQKEKITDPISNSNNYYSLIIMWRSYSIHLLPGYIHFFP